MLSIFQEYHLHSLNNVPQGVSGGCFSKPLILYCQVRPIHAASGLVRYQEEKLGGFRRSKDVNDLCKSHLVNDPTFKPFGIIYLSSIGGIRNLNFYYFMVV